MREQKGRKLEGREKGRERARREGRCGEATPLRQYKGGTNIIGGTYIINSGYSERRNRNYKTRIKLIKRIRNTCK